MGFGRDDGLQTRDSLLRMSRLRGNAGCNYRCLGVRRVKLLDLGAQHTRLRKPARCGVLLGLNHPLCQLRCLGTRLGL